MRPSQDNEESAGGGRRDGIPTADDLQAQIGRLRPGNRRPEKEKKPEDEGVDAFNAELLQKLRQRRGDVAGDDSDDDSDDPEDPDNSEWGARKSSLLDGARKYLGSFFGSRKIEMDELRGGFAHDLNDPNNDQTNPFQDYFGSRKQEDPDDSDEEEYEYEDPDAEDPDAEDPDQDDDLGDFDYNIYQGPALGL